MVLRQGGTECGRLEVGHCTVMQQCEMQDNLSFQPGDENLERIVHGSEVVGKHAAGSRSIPWAGRMRQMTV